MATMLRNLLFAAAIAIVTVPVVGHVAQAQNIRYVSGTGTDTNPCTLTAPCRLLQRAVDVVPNGGVVEMLNSAAYGHVTIAKSVTISGGGRTSIDGQIEIDSAGAVVVVRDLVMSGRIQFAGIKIEDARAVHIENCEIEDFKVGIALSSASELFVTDTVSRNNRNSGLLVFAVAGAKVTIDNSRFENNGTHGLSIAGAETTITRSGSSGNGAVGIVQDGGRMSITGTTAANNAANGFFVMGSGQMTLDTSLASGNVNKFGLVVQAGATARISSSVFTNNPYGIYSVGTLLTRGNNTVSGNQEDDVVGTLTPLDGV